MIQSADIDHIQVYLDHDYCITHGYNLFQYLQEFVNVIEMPPGGWFV